MVGRKLHEAPERAESRHEPYPPSHWVFRYALTRYGVKSRTRLPRQQGAGGQRYSWHYATVKLHLPTQLPALSFH